MMNTRIRGFKEKLITLALDDYQDIPIEAKLITMQLVTNRIIELSNTAIVNELKEEEECKKHTDPE